jgi:hypothetical protein
MIIHILQNSTPTAVNLALLNSYTNNLTYEKYKFSLFLNIEPI